MSKKGYFISLHHRIKLDLNLPSIGALGQKEKELIQGAFGVLMPKYFSPLRYKEVAYLARSHFPHFMTRYTYRGKAKQIRLFRRLGLPHPKTFVFNSVSEVKEKILKNECPLGFPFVLKGDMGGGGSKVFPVFNQESLAKGLQELPQNEPVLIQEWIKNGGMDLRVVLVGNRVKSYFRVAQDSFYNNVSQGAAIDFNLGLDRQAKGIELSMELARMIQTDLAAFDLMFDSKRQPLLIEINFLFGKKGLGGDKGYQQMFEQAVEDWMNSVKKVPS